MTVNSQISLNYVSRIEIGRVSEYPVTADRPEPFFTRDILFVGADGVQTRIVCFANARTDLALHMSKSECLGRSDKNATEMVEEPVA
jgi:hypothetical protein